MFPDIAFSFQWVVRYSGAHSVRRNEPLPYTLRRPVTDLALVDGTFALGYSCYKGATARPAFFSLDIPLVKFATDNSDTCSDRY